MDSAVVRDFWESTRGFSGGLLHEFFPFFIPGNVGDIQGWKPWMKSSQERNSNNCFVTFKSRGRVFVRAFLKLLGVWGATSLEWTLRCCFVNPLPMFKVETNPFTTVQPKIMCVGISLRRFVFFQFKPCVWSKFKLLWSIILIINYKKTCVWAKLPLFSHWFAILQLATACTLPHQRCQRRTLGIEALKREAELQETSQKSEKALELKSPGPKLCRIQHPLLWEWRGCSGFPNKNGETR